MQLPYSSTDCHMTHQLFVIYTQSSWCLQWWKTCRTSCKDGQQEWSFERSEVRSWFMSTSLLPSNKRCLLLTLSANLQSWLSRKLIRTEGSGWSSFTHRFKMMSLKHPKLLVFVTSADVKTGGIKSYWACADWPPKINKSVIIFWLVEVLQPHS